MAASLSLIAFTLLAGYDLLKPAPQNVESVVFVRVPEPMYASPDTDAAAQQVTAESGAYLHLRDRVLSYGVEALPPPMAGAPTPILKYQLLPETADLEPGNAAYLYQRAHAPEWITNLRRDPEYAKLSDYLNKPFKELPREKWGMLLTSKMLQEVDRAARRQYC